MSQDHATSHRGQRNRSAARSVSHHKPPLPAGGSPPHRGPAGSTPRIDPQDRPAGSTHRIVPRDRPGGKGADRQIGGLVHQLPQVTTLGSRDRPRSRGAHRQIGSLVHQLPPLSTRRIMPRDRPGCRGEDLRPVPVPQCSKLPQAAADLRLLFGGRLPVGGHLPAHKKLQKNNYLLFLLLCVHCSLFFVHLTALPPFYLAASSLRCGQGAHKTEKNNYLLFLLFFVHLNALLPYHLGASQQDPTTNSKGSKEELVISTGHYTGGPSIGWSNKSNGIDDTQNESLDAESDPEQEPIVPEDDRMTCCL
ncbi:hypothetical protein NDU88_006336 [Pleurodeles waltl]|uniref:Uncharacterized protein n=1 Tax=Pleurodeles waltl TaxID=8319 RepID=A0AAV7MDT0_PLEWA|nr:hypothetical protein NDU88_006336 [Pleurodeles waltl]